MFLRTWDVDTFRRVCVVSLDRYSSNPYQEIATLCRMVDALGPDISVASINSGSTVLVEAFCENLGSGYRQKLIDYPVFDLRLFRRCLQRTASSVFGSLDGLAMTEFIVNRLKGAETRDWMSSRPALKEGNPDQRLEYASSCGRFRPHHRRLALDCFLFEADWAQRRWR